MPFELCSTRQPGEVIAELLHAIDQLYETRLQSGHPYDKIILIGHSIGSLYARKVYVVACGENQDANFESLIKERLEQLGADSPAQPRPWASKVERIVLLAGMNRGWSISHHMSLVRGVYMTLGSAFGRGMAWVTGRLPIILTIRRARQEKVEWLMDQYTQAKARYPRARFSYVGHSNGTYLLSKALEDYESVRFGNIVFAGSVVRSDYDWSKHIPRQARNILNLVASADWVVAFFPKALQSLHILDLGGAGHDGFMIAGELKQVVQPEDYIVGSHGAALQEGVWNTIARFILTGEAEPPPAAIRVKYQKAWVYYPGKKPLVVWALIGAVLSLILLCVLTSDWAQWAKTLAVVLYVGTIWVVLTKF